MTIDIKYIFLVAICTLCLPCNLSAEQSGEQRSAVQQTLVHNLSLMFVAEGGGNPNVDYVEIFRNPPSTSVDGAILESQYTSASISPTLLEEGSAYKLKLSFLNKSTIENLSKIFKCFEYALAGLEIRNTTKKHPKLTWGIVFYRRDDTRIASIYLDEEGRSGYLDSQVVGFSNQRIFMGCLKDDLPQLWQADNNGSWWARLFYR